MDVLQPIALLVQADGAGVWPSGNAQRFQRRVQALRVRGGAFFAATHAQAAPQHGPKTSTPWRQLFQAQRAAAQLVRIGQRLQGLQRRRAPGVQAVQLGRARKVHGARIHHLHRAGALGRQVQRAQLAVAPQLLVEQRLLLLDELRLQQQRADLARRADVRNVRGLAQHARLVRVAQVREQPRTQVDALADVQRQRVALRLKDVHPRRGRRRLGSGAQMLGIGVQGATGARFGRSGAHGGNT